MIDPKKLDVLGEGDVYESPKCTQCDKHIFNSYHTFNNEVICSPCRAKLETTNGPGTPATRFGRALLWGGAAAGVGWLIYFGILKATGFEFGLIAAVIGYGVGRAVYAGSYERGGWAYQGLAIGLTYLAICGTYFPIILEGMVNGAEQEAEIVATIEAEEAENENGVRPGHPDDLFSEMEDLKAEQEAAELPEEEPETYDVAMGRPEGITQWSVFVAIALTLSLAAPFFFGIGNILGTIILCVGLWEAWKLNPRQDRVFDGPFKMSGAALGERITP